MTRSSPPGRAEPGSLRVLVVCDRPTFDKAMHDALRDGLVRSGCEVVAGLSPERVRPVLEVAMARFEIERALREELDRARDRLAGRQAVERAKGLLMDRLGLSEEEAYTRLRRLAMDRKESLAKAAERVIEASRLLS